MGIKDYGWRSYIRYNEERDKPQISWSLLKRVGFYVHPYWLKAVLLATLITLASLLNLVSPLLFRDLLDNALPNKDVARLNWLALSLLSLPVLTGFIQVAQGYLSSTVGEGIVCDLQQALNT